MAGMKSKLTLIGIGLIALAILALAAEAWTGYPPATSSTKVFNNGSVDVAVTDVTYNPSWPVALPLMAAVAGIAILLWSYLHR